ncbi:MAG: right-handed parallel beta-helix repeat-containing protein [Fimbriimonadaceae bacterium]|nr:right-handed parallel beta-helix repeat-containing protein [Fimbriimonadaceae bacterium]
MSRLWLLALLLPLAGGRAVELTLAPGADLAAVQAQVRAEPRRGSEAISVTLPPGTWRLAAPLEFGPLDSGGPGAPVTWQAAPGAQVVISGGAPVGGWQARGDGLWAAPLPWVRQAPEPFTQLWVNGQRRTLARSPNAGSYFYSQRLLLNSPPGGFPVCGGLTARPGDLGPWISDPGARVCLFHNWVNSYNRVGAADLERRTVRFARDAGIFFLGPSVRYYVENVRAALDAPGEWFCDQAAGELLYRPLPGEDLTTAEVIAPRVGPTLLRLRGEPALGLPVEHLVFRGLSLQHSSADLAPTYEHSVQGAHTQRGAVLATNTRFVRFEDCELAHLGEHGLSLREGCTDNVVTGCHLHDLGGGGVYLAGGTIHQPAEAQLTQRNRVDGNLIHDGGWIYRAGCGVFLGGTACYNQILRNEVLNLSWIGIHLGWSWSGRDPAATHHNEIAYNRLHHLGNGVLNDLAGIYTLGVQPGTVLHHNRIHDISRFQRGDGGYGGWGIYLDAGSSGIRVSDNIVSDTQDGGLHLHCDGFPWGDEIVNNIFAFADSGQLQRNNNKEPATVHAHLERNIVYNRSRAMYGGSNWAPASRFTAERNLYWTEDPAGPDFYDGTFAAWQATGRDAAALVTDPLFVDAAARDFRLRPESPALRLGFRPIDLSGVGLVGQPALQAIAARLTARAVELAPPPDPEDATRRMDWEEFEPGETPEGAVEPDGPVGVTVSDRQPAAGRRCLRFVDGPAAQPWMPHWYLRRQPGSAALTVRCDLRQDAAQPAACDLELRDWPAMGPRYSTGPLLRLAVDGTLTAADGPDWHPVGRVAPGTWCRLELRLDEREGAPPTYTVRLNDGPPSPPLRYLSPTFRRANWVGLAGLGTAPGEFYADNLVVGP